MLRLSGDDFEAVFFAVDDVVTRRRMCNKPIPREVLALHQKLTIASAVGRANDDETEELGNDLIDSDTAAEIIGCSSRWVTKIHASLDGMWLAGRWVFHRQKVIDFAEGRSRESN